MPFRTAEVVGTAVEDDTICHIVERVLAATDAVVARQQQVTMLVDHAHAEKAFHCDNKLG